MGSKRGVNCTTYLRTDDEDILIALDKMGGAPAYLVNADAIPPLAFADTNPLKASVMQQVRDCAKANRLHLQHVGQVAVSSS